MQREPLHGNDTATSATTINMTGPAQKASGSHGFTSIVSKWNANVRSRPASVFAILKCQRPAVRLGDLTAQHETDPRSVALGRKERHEQVGHVLQSRPLVIDMDFQ
jgi:hypothetical protein